MSRSLDTVSHAPGNTGGSAAANCRVARRPLCAHWVGEWRMLFRRESSQLCVWNHRRRHKPRAFIAGGRIRASCVQLLNELLADLKTPIQHCRPRIADSRLSGRCAHFCDRRRSNEAELAARSLNQRDHEKSCKS